MSAKDEELTAMIQALERAYQDDLEIHQVPKKPTPIWCEHGHEPKDCPSCSKTKGYWSDDKTFEEQANNPEREWDWSVYEELIGIETNAARVKDYFHATLGHMEQLEHEIKRLKVEISRKNENILGYGNHKTDCTWYDIVNSGRILKDGEEKHCSCGWSGIKARLESDNAKVAGTDRVPKRQKQETRSEISVEEVAKRIRASETQSKAKRATTKRSRKVSK